VKYTFDAVRGDSTSKLRLNPRRLWYGNVEAIETAGDAQVSFKLKRPQPSLLAMLTSGYSPVYPAHVDIAQLRTSALGTGPFKLASYVRGRTIELAKNRDYHIKNRPYLDGVSFAIITSSASHMAALASGQVEGSNPSYTTKPIANSLKAANSDLKFFPLVSSATANIVVNTNKPPLSDLALRRAVNLAMDRNGIVKSVYQGGAIIGGAMLAQPGGVWGLNPEQLSRLPGYGDGEANKAEARAILASKGYSLEKPLKIVIATRALHTYVEPAIWAIGELKAVGIQAELRQVETGNWFSLVARRDFQMAINATGLGTDDPDINFYENFRCGSQRNYSDYCNADVERMVDEQSAEGMFVRRLPMVNQVDIALQRDVARPILAYRIYYHPHQSYVKNWIPHVSTFNGWRFVDVWLDK
jgi:peptide/nickel transport system substrate-binding protein